MSNFLLYFGASCLANDFFQVAGIFGINYLDIPLRYFIAMSFSASHLMDLRESRKKRERLMRAGYDAASAEAKVTCDEARDREQLRFGRVEWAVAVCGGVVGLLYGGLMATKTRVVEGVFLGFGFGCAVAMICRSFRSGGKASQEDSSETGMKSK